MDTLHYTEKLLEAGVPREQAEQQVKVMKKMADDHLTSLQQLENTIARGDRMHEQAMARMEKLHQENIVKMDKIHQEAMVKSDRLHQEAMKKVELTSEVSNTNFAKIERKVDGGIADSKNDMMALENRLLWKLGVPILAALVGLIIRIM